MMFERIEKRLARASRTRQASVASFAYPVVSVASVSVASVSVASVSVASVSVASVSVASSVRGQFRVGSSRVLQ